MQHNKNLISIAHWGPLRKRHPLESFRRHTTSPTYMPNSATFVKPIPRCRYPCTTYVQTCTNLYRRWSAPLSSTPVINSTSANLPGNLNSGAQALEPGNCRPAAYSVKAIFRTYRAYHFRIYITCDRLFIDNWITTRRRRFSSLPCFLRNYFYLKYVQLR